MAKTYAELQQQINQLKEEAARLELRQSREAREVIKRMRKAIAAYGLTADDLFGEEPPIVVKKTVRKRKTGKKGWPMGVKKPVKYQDDEGNTWSGGGSIPRWLRAHLEAGHSIEEFLIRRVA